MNQQKKNARGKADVSYKEDTKHGKRVQGWTHIGELLPERVARAVAAGEIKRIGQAYYEKKEFIEYWMAGWVAAFKQADARIKQLENVIPDLPIVKNELSLRSLYEAMVRDEKQNKINAKKRIKWLGACHDKATGQKRFYLPSKLTRQYGLDKDQIKQSTDLVEFIGGYTQLKKCGQNFKGRCPLHKEKTPSFYVRPDKGWYCHGCHKGGDVFSFVMEAEGVDFPTAVKQVGGQV